VATCRKLQEFGGVLGEEPGIDVRNRYSRTRHP
jgi:hypothetical protein